MNKERISEKVIQYQNGNTDAFADIYELSNKELYVYARFLENNHKVEYSAEDLLQDTYVEMLKSLEKLQEPDAFSRWSKTIMENLLKQKARRTKREVHLMGQDDEEDGLDFFEQQQETDEEWLPGAELDKREVGEIVLDALHQLPLEQKKVAYLYYMKEMSIKDIAAELQISEGTVKSRMFNARENMRVNLEQYEKKHDIRLHGILGLPFISSLLKDFSAETVLNQRAKEEILSNVMQQDILTTAGTVTSATTTADMAAANVATVSGSTNIATAMTKTGIAAFAKTVAGKAIIGTVAVALAGGGIFYAATSDHDNAETEPSKEVVALDTDEKADEEQPVIPDAEELAADEDMEQPETDDDEIEPPVATEDEEEQEQEEKMNDEAENVEHDDQPVEEPDTEERKDIEDKESQENDSEESVESDEVEADDTESGDENVEEPEEDTDNTPIAPEIGVGGNVASQMVVGGDSWFAFTPQASDSYCFYVDMNEKFEADYLDIFVYQDEVVEDMWIFGGVLSDGKEDGTYRFYFSEDGTLAAGTTYYICFKWTHDCGFNDIHLIQGESL